MSYKKFNLNFYVKVLMLLLFTMSVFSLPVLSANLPEKIVVGCLEPLTGAHAVFGTEGKIGMEFAVKHINETDVYKRQSAPLPVMIISGVTLSLSANFSLNTLLVPSG